MARQKDENLKTQIRLGEEDLILMVKFKGDKDWEIEPQLSKMGDISDPEWHKIWPNI